MITLPLRSSLASLVLLGLGAFTSGRASAADSESTSVLTAEGFSPERIARIDRVVDSYIAAHQCAGATVLIRRDGRTCLLKAYGMQDQEAGIPMKPDSIFRIASMTKAVTATAVMMLYENGQLLLGDPVDKYIPSFAHPMVATGAPTGATGPYTLVPAKTPITIRELLTHTSGLVYGGGLAYPDYKKAHLDSWYLTDHDETIAQAVDRLATLPLNGQPGESWQYGLSFDVLGRLIEVVSGETLDHYFKYHIFDPLGMHDTSFFVPAEKLSRFTALYGMENGKLLLKESPATSAFVSGPRKCFSGGAGLVSTVVDYGRFLQMLLNGGELDGVRLLSLKSVELMHTNAVGSLYHRSTDAFGYGFWIINDLGYAGDLGSQGEYGWGSIYYPQYLIDPKERMTAVIMAQLLPSGGVDLSAKFKVLTYQALER